MSYLRGAFKMTPDVFGSFFKCLWVSLGVFGSLLGSLGVFGSTLGVFGVLWEYFGSLQVALEETSVALGCLQVSLSFLR